MMEIAWLVRQVLMFVAYSYLYILLVFVMTAIFFPEEPKT